MGTSEGTRSDKRPNHSITVRTRTTQHTNIYHSVISRNYHFILFKQHHDPTDIGVVCMFSHNDDTNNPTQTHHRITAPAAASPWPMATDLTLSFFAENWALRCSMLGRHCLTASLDVYSSAQRRRPGKSSPPHQAHAGHLLKHSRPTRKCTECYVQVADGVASKESLAVKLRL